MVNRNCGGEVSCPHLGITSLTLGVPWWGAPTKKKLNGFTLLNPHVGITSLPLGDPLWGCLTKQKN